MTCLRVRTSCPCGRTCLQIQEAVRDRELGDILTPLRRTVGSPTSLLAGCHQAILIDAPVGPRAVVLPAMQIHCPRLVGSDCCYGGSEHCGGDYSFDLHINSAPGAILSLIQSSCIDDVHPWTPLALIRLRAAAVTSPLR